MRPPILPDRLPGEGPEEAIDLTDGVTLKGWGRRGHGLNGKDADLYDEGQVIIKEAWWFPESVSCTFVRWYTVNEDYDYTDPPVTITYPATWENGDEEAVITELVSKIEAETGILF